MTQPQRKFVSVHRYLGTYRSLHLRKGIGGGGDGLWRVAPVLSHPAACGLAVRAVLKHTWVRVLSQTRPGFGLGHEMNLEKRQRYFPGAG